MISRRTSRPKPSGLTGDSPATLPGLGPQTVAWLADVGIATIGELQQVGAVAAYARLKHRDPKRVSHNALWGLYAALNGIRWTDISPEVKARLLTEAGE
jgi:DNA transformation protein